MTGAELDREYLAMLGQTPLPDLFAELEAAGVPQRTILLTMPAIARIAVKGDRYQPDPDGGFAFIIPARIDYAETPESADPEAVLRTGAIVDLVAVHPAHPDHWALRAGNGEWLGSIAPQYMSPEPVPVWRSPLAWLRGDCVGLAPLSTGRPDLYRLFTRIGTLVAEDAAHMVELRRVLEHPVPTPRVLIGRERRSHDAA